MEKEDLKFIVGELLVGTLIAALLWDFVKGAAHVLL